MLQFGHEKNMFQTQIKVKLKLRIFIEFHDFQQLNFTILNLNQLFTIQFYVEMTYIYKLCT